MRIIPVIDLQDQYVVHAKRGQRAEYQPISSKLCPSADLDAVMQAYLKLYPFTSVYIADLNALRGCTKNQPLIQQLLAKYPQCQFWLDSGYQPTPSIYQQFANYLPVMGSEAFDSGNWQQLRQFQGHFILSLDFSSNGPMGATELFRASAIWPQQVIVMTLAQVGSNAGPDLTKLQYYRKQFPQYDFIASGGVRDKQDLLAIQALGIEQVLVASALHNGAIRRADLDLLGQHCPPKKH